MAVDNFFPMPSEFVSNFIIGFTSFKTPKSTSIIDFQWDFDIQAGVHGVAFPVSVATTPLSCGDLAVPIGYFTVFYIKTWTCPNETNLFDPDTKYVHCMSCGQLLDLL